MKTKSPKYREWALTLWEGGPSVSPVSDFPPFVMQEYRHAVDRGTLESANCGYCNPASSELNETERLVHFQWHIKFRGFLALRGMAHQDKMILRIEQEQSMLSDLTELWKQVDSEAPCFALLLKLLSP